MRMRLHAAPMKPGTFLCHRNPEHRVQKSRKKWQSTKGRSLCRVRPPTKSSRSQVIGAGIAGAKSYSRQNISHLNVMADPFRQPYRANGGIVLVWQMIQACIPTKHRFQALCRELRTLYAEPSDLRRAKDFAKRRP